MQNTNTAHKFFLRLFKAPLTALQVQRLRKRHKLSKSVLEALKMDAEDSTRNDPAKFIEVLERYAHEYSVRDNDNGFIDMLNSLNNRVDRSISSIKDIYKNDLAFNDDKLSMISSELSLLNSIIIMYSDLISTRFIIENK